MTNPPRDGSERDGGDRVGGTGGPQADPDQTLTQPVQPYDRSQEPPPGVQPYGPAAQQYGQPGPGQPPPYYGQELSGQPAWGQPYPPQQYGPHGQYAPPGATAPRKSHLRLYLGLAALALLLVFAMVLANALGPTVLNRSAVERDVAAQFEEREGVPIDLTCDEEMRVEKGQTYQCTGVTADGEEVTLEITVTDENFAEYTWAER
jgi:hypothetical protein